ncbi:MAG: hypothetical protein HY608_05495 [Planctomycetes bacterium]|nr:hypothetical protein [Planctomycetota bacterium]
MTDPRDPWTLFADMASFGAKYDRMTPEDRQVLFCGADLILEENRLIREILDGTPAPAPER